ncbi:bifunctional adenosylcobinamide kinase/adenosylcobinamide-phosphate guanylyltransferase [Shewanella sp. 125m-1]
MIHLVLGGARSGKSGFAESQVKQFLAEQSKKQQAIDCLYFATAQALDTEMDERISHHQTQREADTIPWRTIECPLKLSAGLKQHASANSIILVDCLTLWLTNHLLQEEACWQLVKAEFLQSLSELAGTVVLVSNEVGCGIVPMGEISRRFVDEAGWLHQNIAAIADRVTLVTAGLPLNLKG